MKKLARSAWPAVVLCVAYGGGLVAASVIRGERVAQAIQAFAILIVIALLLVLAGRKERMRQRLFDPDERADWINIQAGVWAGAVVFLVLAVGFLVEWARGNSGYPYLWLALLYVGFYYAVLAARHFRG